MISRYRLDELTKLAGELGLDTHRVDDERLDVILDEGCRLAFCNLVAEDDTLVGFDGTPWHSHGRVQFLTGSATYVEYDELEILLAVAYGDLVVVSEFRGQQLYDRWLAHRNEALNVRHIGPGEELRIFRLPERPPHAPEPSGSRERVADTPKDVAADAAGS